ncbi:plastidial pyruvate kinase 1 [Pyrus ussuriensis x Pyrus communis]|uniref:Plastidial pyruvate kinase 1 n=1 Tax=Pyrus ussuriensis x Pyrus communis TaxID=2448454 RepID=A0A5N5H1V8_9ROSA|nr:plastidial pyruvate kinase 1 [Pyrus ussuriensis x Pyrus communis]
MSSFHRKSDEYPQPLYRQGGSSGRVGYFKAAHVKINSNELFRDFLEVYKHVIPSGVRVKGVKDDSGHEPCGNGASTRKRAIKFHPYYFVLGFTFPMLRLFQDVICSMKCAPTQCSPNAVPAMVGFSKLSMESGSLTLLLSCVSRLPLSVPSSPGERWSAPKERDKADKGRALARPIAAVELAANGCGKKRSSSSACEPSVNSSAAEKLVIDLTSLKGAKMTVDLEPVRHAVPKFVSKRPSGAKSGCAFERLAAMKSRKVDSVAKVASRPVLLSAVIDSSTKKGKSARTDSCERSTKFEAGEFPKVCALLKADLLEDVDACAKFVDSVGKVFVRSDSFAKHLAYSRMSFLIATMHKTLILAAKSMRVNQDAVKCAKEAEVLEIAHEEAVHLNAKLSATQAMLEAVEKEISRVSLVVEDLDCVNLELRFACFAKDEELIFMYAEVFRLKEIASKLKSKEVDLQGALFSNVNLKNELDELQGAHTGLVEENAQLKNEKVGHEVALAFCQADFCKLGYVDHLQGRASYYEFSEKDFETFSISPVDLLNFSFEVAFGGVVDGQAVQVGAAEDKLMEALVARNGTTAEAVYPTLSLRF